SFRAVLMPREAKGGQLRWLAAPNRLLYRAPKIHPPIWPACRARKLTMKQEINPGYHTIKVVMTAATESPTPPPWAKTGDVLHLDIDPKSHPAWTGGQQQLVDRGGRVSRFQKKFSGFLKTDEKK